MKLIVIDQDTERHEIETSEGIPAMEAIRNAGLAIAAQCGGCASCATCHVYVDETWLDKLPPASEIELLMLEMAEGFMPNSRLSCQITMTDSLDNLELRLAPGTEY